MEQTNKQINNIRRERKVSSAPIDQQNGVGWALNALVPWTNTINAIRFVSSTLPEGDTSLYV